MKVLALLASPRKNGNTEILLERVIEGAVHEGCQVETVNLHTHPVRPIDDCNECESHGSCTIDENDNYGMIIEKFLESDCIILATPTYWYSVSAQMKAFIDRWYCSERLMPGFHRKIRGKKVAVIAVHGEDDPAVTKHLFGQLQRSFQYLGLDFIGKVQGKALASGEMSRNKDVLEKAYKLGISIGKKKYYSAQ